ncbi:MAG: hypothetical protein J1E60_06575 [Christensenellaceae bacterium]|nr:hypothetical protein [Christensenellaceae bacterium]
MKVWGRIRKDNKTVAECVVEIPEKDAESVLNWVEPVGEVCGKLDLSRPIILDKHVNDLLKFSHTHFKRSDFMESVKFDRLEIELF